MPWIFENASRCRGCGAPILWWTTPLGKKFPSDPIGYDPQPRERVSGIVAEMARKATHWATCKKAASFCKKPQGEGREDDGTVRSTGPTGAQSPGEDREDGGNPRVGGDPSSREPGA